MKKLKLSIIKLWNQLQISKKISAKITSLAQADKEQVIIDQLFFGLNTDESIELFEKIRLKFKTRMEIRKLEAVSVEQSISKYYEEA